MNVGKNKVVSLTYTLTLDNGEIADQTGDDHPFTFIQGIGQTLAQFDKHLENLAAGDEFDFEIEPEHAYGISNENYKVRLSRDVFDGPDVPKDILKIGNVVPMQDEQGHPMDGVIKEIDDTSVLIDFNHPLADEKLHFKGRILSVREATSEELSHGHVHGPGGHHH